jgi:hypothetical protein
MNMLNIGILVVGVILITAGIQNKPPKQVVTDAVSGKISGDPPKPPTANPVSPVDPGGLTNPNLPNVPSPEPSYN